MRSRSAERDPVQLRPRGPGSWGHRAARAVVVFPDVRTSRAAHRDVACACMPGCLMATVRRAAPILAVHDLVAAMAHYERLGFAVREYSGGGYAFAVRDGVELHLGVAPEHERHTSSAYLFVDDADELAAAWRAAGVEVHTPEDTEWGQHEGVAVDPDGNVIRFGSPMRHDLG